MANELYSKLGLPPGDVEAGIAPVLTLYNRERALAGMREAFGMWLNVPGLDVAVVLEDGELPRVPAPETIYLFHTPGNGESLMHLRSLLNRLKRLKPARRIFLCDAITVSPALKTILLGTTATGTGEGAFVQHEKITARMISRADFEKFRETIV